MADDAGEDRVRPGPSADRFREEDPARLERVNVKELARQLCLLCHAAYGRLRPLELLMRATVINGVDLAPSDNGVTATLHVASQVAIDSPAGGGGAYPRDAEAS